LLCHPVCYIFEGMSEQEAREDHECELIQHFHAKLDPWRRIIATTMFFGPIYLIGFELWWNVASSSPSPSGLAASFFGMHNGFSGGSWPSISVGALGKGQCVNWEYIENPRGTYDWSRLDAKVAAAAAHGVDLFYSNDSVPGWALSNQASCAYSPCGFGAKNCAQIPDNLADLDNFFTALTQRYCGTALKYIELWNEPYIANGAPGYVIPASDMATIATHEYNIIRAGCPSIKIISPSMASSGYESYANNYFAAGGPTGVDIVSLHAYPDSSSSNCTTSGPESIVLGRYLNSATLHNIINTYVPNKPLWDTETSWNQNSGPCFNTPDTQAAFASRWYLNHWTNNFSRVYWYGWDEGNFGTLSPAMTGSNIQANAVQQTYNWMIGASNPVSVVNGNVYTVTMTLGK
jgi:hypothetical protein